MDLPSAFALLTTTFIRAANDLASIFFAIVLALAFFPGKRQGISGDSHGRLPESSARLAESAGGDLWGERVGSGARRDDETRRERVSLTARHCATRRLFPSEHRPPIQMPRTSAGDRGGSWTCSHPGAGQGSRKEKKGAREPERWHFEGMTALQRADIKRSVEAWKRAAPVMESVRRADIRAAETVSSIAAFRGTALAKAKTHPPALTSGLVEQQRWFRRLAEDR